MVTSGVSRNSLQEQLAQAMEAVKKGTEVVALILKQLKEMDQVNSEHKSSGKTGGKSSGKASGKANGKGASAMASGKASGSAEESLGGSAWHPSGVCRRDSR